MCCLYNHKTTISVINMTIQDEFILFSVVSESFMQSNWSCQDNLTDIKQIKCSGIIYLINFSSSEQIFRMPTVCFFCVCSTLTLFFCLSDRNNTWICNDTAWKAYHNSLPLGVSRHAPSSINPMGNNSMVRSRTGTPKIGFYNV